MKIWFCIIGMIACSICILAIIGKTILGYGMDWWYLFAFGMMFYLFGRKYDKLTGEE